MEIERNKWIRLTIVLADLENNHKTIDQIMEFSKKLPIEVSQDTPTIMRKELVEVKSCFTAKD